MWQQQQQQDYHVIIVHILELNKALRSQSNKHDFTNVIGRRSKENGKTTVHFGECS